MPRYPIPGAPSMGGGTVSPYRQGDNIADLIYASGAGRANAQLESGDIWGSTIAGIGQGIGNAIGQREQSKQMAKRDAAWVAYVENEDWSQDPKRAYAMALRTWGPEEGPKQFQALQAAGHLAGDKRDPEKDAKSLGVIVGAMGKLQDPARARLYPQAYKLAKGVYPNLEVSPEYDPAKWPELEAIGAQLRGEKPPELKTATVPDAQGNPMLKSVTPEELAAGVPTYEAQKRQMVTVPGPNGQPMAKMVDEAQLEAGVPTYQAPKGSGEKFWVVRDGKPMRVSESDYRQGDLPANTREQGRPVTSGDAGKIAEYDTSLDDLNRLAGTLTGSKATGTAAKVGASLWNPITELTGWGADAKAKQATIDRVKQVIGKALEGGVLRKEDEYKYEKILPTIGDVPTVVKAKLDGLWKAIQQRRQTQIDSLADAGYDVKKFEARAPRERQLAPIPPPAAGGAPPLISSPEEAKRLPPGTLFRTPDGRTLRVPGA